MITVVVGGWGMHAIIEETSRANDFSRERAGYRDVFI